jgi:hypothetical protein
VPEFAMGIRAAMSEDCDHDWQVVNHDENREILKCTKCGELKRE